MDIFKVWKSKGLFYQILERKWDSSMGLWTKDLTSIRLWVSQCATQILVKEWEEKLQNTSSQIMQKKNSNKLVLPCAKCMQSVAFNINAAIVGYCYTFAFCYWHTIQKFTLLVYFSRILLEVYSCVVIIFITNHFYHEPW